MYRFWQDNDFYKGWKKSQCNIKKETTPTEKSCSDYSELVLLKPFPDSDDDIYDAFNEKEGFGHQMDALKHCIDNKIPFLRWNGMLYDWHQNRIK